jgi:hypothetical protein
VYVNLNNNPNPSIRDNYLYFSSNFFFETPTTSISILSGHLPIPVTEGSPKEFVYTASGVPSEVIRLYTPNSDNFNYEVLLIDDNGEIIDTVHETDEIFMVQDISKYYFEIQNAPDFNSILIKLGDGKNSRKLFQGQRVLIRYAETSGSSGNIPSAGVIVRPSFPIINGEGNLADIYTSNIYPIIGGKDIEDIESIRTKSRRLFGAGFRGASKEDWIALVESHPSIYKAIAWSDYETDPQTAATNNSFINIAAITVSKTSPSLGLQQEITEKILIPKKSLTDIIVWRNTNIINPKFYINAKVSGDTFPNIRKQITEALQKKYDILRASFYTSIYRSNYTAVIDNLDTVDYHETVIAYLEKSSNNPKIGPTTNMIISVSKIVAPPTEQILIKPGSLKILLKRKINFEWVPDTKIIGQDNGFQVIVGQNNYTVSGSVDYTTNEIFFNIETLIVGPTIPAGEPDAGQPISQFGVLNPTNDEANGFMIYIEYLTVDGNGNQERNLRLASNQDIIALDPDDLIFTLSYTEVT